MWKQLWPWGARAGAGVVLALVLAGCETIQEKTALATYTTYQDEGGKPAFDVRFNYSDAVVVDNTHVAEQYYEGTAKVGRAEVAFQAGLKEQAGELAMEMEQYIADVEQHLGRELQVPVRAYLLRRDRMPGEVTGGFQRTSDVYQFPMFVADQEESFETIRSTNPFYPYMFVHELAKLSLVDPARPPLILDDQKDNPLVKSRYFTRWFREGLANYAEFLVYEKMRQRTAPDGTPTPLSTFENSHVYQQPLTSLAKVGEDLFSWDAFDDRANNPDYHNAAMGLFILVEDRYGDGAVRSIMDELEKLSFVDGQVLEETFNKTLGTDIRQMVGTFTLQDTGTEATTLTPATARNYGLKAPQGLYVNNIADASLAKTAGLQRGDVIVQLNRTVIANHLDYELAMLEAQRHGNVYFMIDRMGERLTVGAQFEVPGAPAQGGAAGGSGGGGVGGGLVTGDVLGFGE